MNIPTAPITLQFQVECLIDRLAADLLDRTGHQVSIPEFDALTQKLSERIGDLVEELVWDGSGSNVRPIGDLDSRTGDGREPEGLSNQTTRSERSGRPR